MPGRKPAPLGAGQTPDQKREAWQISAEFRRKRSIVRDAIRSGELDFYDAIEGRLLPEIAEIVDRITLERMLLYIPNIGKAKRHDLLEAFSAAPNVRLGTLTPQRRRELAVLVQDSVEQFILPHVGKRGRL